MTINDLVTVAHTNAKEKGFWDGDNHNIGEKLALIHSEVSEALEDARKEPKLIALWDTTSNGKPVGFPSELADIIIRVADLAGYLDIDLERVIEAKVAFNATRSRKHGKAF